MLGATERWTSLERDDDGKDPPIRPPDMAASEGKGDKSNAMDKTDMAARALLFSIIF
jgi:hypothetical protein